MNSLAKILLLGATLLTSLNCSASLIDEESVVIPNCIKRGGATLTLENATIILVDDNVGYDLKSQENLKKILDDLQPLDFINIIKYNDHKQRIELLGIIPSKDWKPAKNEKAATYKVTGIQNCMKIADIEFAGQKLNASFKTLQSNSSSEKTTIHTRMWNEVFSNYIPKANKNINIYWFASNPALTDLAGNELNNDYTEELVNRQLFTLNAVMPKNNKIIVKIINQKPGYSAESWNSGAWNDYFGLLNVKVESNNEQTSEHN
ncbi:TPA: hypothetical protein RQN23_002914 [Aeromonas veronii]|nr:hypothetical protein [Aeromonas veronii]